MKHTSEESEFPRQRTTFRLKNSNFDFVYEESLRLGISMNSTLNIMIGHLKRARRQKTAAESDSKVTAK